MHQCKRSFRLPMALLLALMLIVSIRAKVSASEENAVLYVKVSSEASMVSELPIQNGAALVSHIAKAKRVAAPYLPVTDTYLHVRRVVKGQSEPQVSKYYVDDRGLLYEEGKQEAIKLGRRITAKLLKDIYRLRQTHYGSLLSWEEASTWLPLYTKFKVIDLETGLSFDVQRRAGKEHADVQPLTKEDTAVMKKIYSGKWSWNRRAILVQTDKQRLAASMHGMPHGGDGIPDNQFSGHFCIHFAGSVTHGSGQMDPGHQWMVLKAAGQLGAEFAESEPAEVAEAFLVGLKQDPQLMKYSFSSSNPEQLAYFLREQTQITAMRYKLIEPKQEKAAKDALTAELSAEVDIYRENRGEDHTKYIFYMKRGSLLEPWKIGSIALVSSED